MHKKIYTLYRSHISHATLPVLVYLSAVYFHLKKNGNVSIGT